MALYAVSEVVELFAKNREFLSDHDQIAVSFPTRDRIC